MKPAFRYPIAAALAAAAFTTSAAAETTLLTDSFDTEASFTAAPNADQAGILAPAGYTVGNPFGTPYQRRGAGVLELGFDGTTATAGARVFTDADYISVANTLNSPIRITFDIGASQVDWVGLLLGTASAWMDGGGTTTEFSALFRNDGTGNKWVNGVNLNATATDTSSLITLELRNTAGTGSAFNGTGSVARLWRGTTDLGTYTLEQLTATNGKIAFAAWNPNGGAGGTFDNLSVIATVTAATNRWSGAVDGNWDETTANFTGGDFATIKANGATSVLFGDVSGTFSPVTNSSLTIAPAGVEIADVIFDNNSVAYSIASGGTAGITGAANLVKSGSGLLTVGNPNTYTGTTTISSGTLALTGGNHRLPITTALTLASPGVLRLDGNDQEVASLSSGGSVVNGNVTISTFTVNQGVSTTFSGNFGGPGTDENNLALVKAGSGSLSLTAASTFTGGTTINNGTLSLNHEPVGIANTALGAMAASNLITINNGGILTGTVNNWLSSTQVASGGGNAITIEINAGGKLLGANNRITGLGNITLNGGTIEVSSGLNAFGWFAAYNLGGDITVSGSAPSFITTSSGADGSANLQMADGFNGASGGGTNYLIVDDVTTSPASDLVISARLANGTLIKDGAGTVEIAAGETGTGFPVSWEIEQGALVVAEGATFEFRVTDTMSNQVLKIGPATATATFNGTLNINTSAVTLTTGMTWSLIDVAGLGAQFGPNFAVGNGFSDLDNDGIWTKSDGIGDWSFSKGTGELRLDTGNDYDDWADGFGLTGGPDADDDNDGLRNREEYAFGLLPNNGASVNPIAIPLDKDTKTFSYTRRDSSLTELNYSVWFSTDLDEWTKDTDAIEGAAVLNGQVETVPVMLSNLPGDPLPDKLFIQIRAE